MINDEKRLKAMGILVKIECLLSREVEPDWVYIGKIIAFLIKSNILVLSKLNGIFVFVKKDALSDIWNVSSIVSTENLEEAMLT